MFISPDFALLLVLNPEKFVELIHSMDWEALMVADNVFTIEPIFMKFMSDPNAIIKKYKSARRPRRKPRHEARYFTSRNLNP